MVVSSGDRSFSARIRALFGILGGCLVVFLGVSCSGSETSELELTQEAETPMQPNIVFILTDDLDFALAQKMPNLRSLLVEQGASFENAFASQSLCCPSRATVLTGQYAHNHGIKDNKPPEGGFQKFRNEGLEEDTIAVRLQQEGGYRTAYFGKYLNGYPGAEPASYVPPGWDEWHGKLLETLYYGYGINHNGEVVSYGSETEDYFTDVLSRQAMEYVRNAASDPNPFFIHLAPEAPHGPATPAERHKDAFADEEAPRPPSFDEENVSDKTSWIRKADRITEDEASEIDTYHRKRLRSMLAVDEMVASLVEELESTGELDNTYIFFTSDNGWFEGQHRIRKEKDRPYEESARVPLFVRGPGVPAGAGVENLVLNTDLAPTFAGLAGLKEFPADGRSLAPLLKDKDHTWRSAVLLEGFVGHKFRAYGAIRTETYKYVEYDNGEKELYDLTNDPYELESIHESADPSLLEDLQARLEELRDCAYEGCREAEGTP
jgi:arylsulfatase A-like enzyme